jgi:NADPH-dependent 2,4-dienoyl-CoA reductase/sulfur reductase-like enzyme
MAGLSRFREPLEMKFDRRRFLQAFGAAAAVSVSPTLVRAASAPHIVVIGGGFAGATVAKYLRMWSGQTIDVTLVDPNAGHVSCVLSNLVLNDQITLQELTMSHGSLSGFFGVKVVQDRAAEVDGSGKRVRLDGAGWLNYDHLVIATGIGFDDPPGIDYQKTPHAWIAGPQTQLLASQVGALGPKSTFVMTVPKSPYRCPPGPYERACLVADILDRRGFNQGDAKVVVLDANAHIQAERHTFEKAFFDKYRNIVDYRPNVTLNAVDSQQRRLDTSAGQFEGDVVNVIPNQQALPFVRESGLTGGGAWAPVDVLTYESTVPGFSSVHIIGDSQDSNQPKSAHMANAQAKICADAIIRELAGVSNTTEERVKNITTNSACYSPITVDEASWLTANFYYDPASGQMKLRTIGEADKWSRENYKDMFAWASNLFTDSFH